MEKEKAIKVLNSLITTNIDRIEGYETASKETNETGLKSLFEQFILTSQQCKEELVMEVMKLDGEIASGTNTSEKIFRMWMNINVALTGDDRRAMLFSCEYREDKTLDTYDKALENDLKYLTLEQRTFIIDQKSILHADHDLVRALRYVAVEA